MLPCCCVSEIRYVHWQASTDGSIRQFLKPTGHQQLEVAGFGPTWPLNQQTTASSKSNLLMPHVKKSRFGFNLNHLRYEEVIDPIFHRQTLADLPKMASLAPTTQFHWFCFSFSVKLCTRDFYVELRDNSPDILRNLSKKKPHVFVDTNIFLLGFSTYSQILSAAWNSHHAWEPLHFSKSFWICYHQ